MKPSNDSLKLRGWMGVVLLLSLVFLAGCYETDQEIILMSDAKEVPGLLGEYHNDPGTIFTQVTLVPGTCDYHYIQRNQKGETTSTGTLRAIHLRGDIYLFQEHDSGQSEWTLFFAQFTIGRDFTKLEVAEEVTALAQRMGVSVSRGDSIKGDRRKILAFLLAHKDVRLVDEETLAAERDAKLAKQIKNGGGGLGERFPMTRTRLLTAEEMKPLALEDIQYAINEMFARHGAVFNDPKVSALFQKQPWYKPRAGLSFNDIEKEFNSFEKSNLEILDIFRDFKR